MLEVTGDFWEYGFNPFLAYDALVCTTNHIVKNNGKLVMGAGIAKDFRDKFTDLDLKWGNRLNRKKHVLGVMAEQVDGLHRIYAVSFPTKYDWRHPSSIDLIENSAKVLAGLTDLMGWNRVLMTRPGCGCGGLEWSKVKPVIAPLLNDRFVVIDK